MSKLSEYRFDKLYKMESGISTTKEQAGHGAPFVSFGDIYNNAILPDELTQKMDTSQDEQEKYSVKKGDIFLTRTSEVLDELAMSSVAVKDYPNATFSGFAKRLRPLQDDITYDKFMAFYLRSDYFRKIVNSKSVMTLRASFNEAIFSYIKIVLPEYEHQVKVGDLFYEIERKIRNNNAINAELEATAKTIYDYWFLQFEFPDENGKPYKSSGGKMVWNEELKREIPEGWEVKTLSEASDVLYGYPLSTELFSKVNGVPVVRIRDILQCTYSAYTSESVGDKYLSEEKDLLIGMDGNFHMNFWHRAGDCINQRIVRVRGNKGISNLQIYFEITPFIKAKEQNNARSTVGHLSDKDIKQIRILDAKDDSITNIFELLLSQMINNSKENQELASLRDFLLPLLMNGQVGFKEKTV